MSDVVVLPEDLIVEILSWIPIFRCVSKSWNSLIFTPKFIKLHFQRSPKYTHIFMNFSFPFIKYDFKPSNFASIWSLRDLFESPSSAIRHGRRLVGIRDGSYPDCANVKIICKGLVCLLYYDCVYDDLKEHYYFRFWNPATKLISGESPRFFLCRSNYRSTDVQFGFGFDDLSDTFKVVTMAVDIKSQQREVRVHCLGDMDWRKVLIPCDHRILSFEGKFVGGTINWLACPTVVFGSNTTQIDPVVTVHQLVIFSFDLKNETYKYIPMSIPIDSKPPMSLLIDSSPPEVGILNHCLCLYYDRMETFVVWLMREFGDDKSWTQLLNISYEHLQIHEPLCTPICYR
ncbi:hypothetical protein Fmac_029131 [Flemingia macrophylla]|uniref:F-box domain-containing protein n=1 Tax=Flemingia macrophylla TaxID=520843 RepID=A0ABD1L9I4_9FABA